MGLVRPSAILWSLRTNPISDMILSRNPSLVAAMSNMSLFSDVRDPFDIISNKDLESVRSCTETVRLYRVPSSLASVAATSNMSLKAITSPARADRTTRFDLYDLKCVGTVLPYLSESITIWPS